MPRNLARNARCAFLEDRFFLIFLTFWTFLTFFFPFSLLGSVLGLQPFNHIHPGLLAGQRGRLHSAKRGRHRQGRETSSARFVQRVTQQPLQLGTGASRRHAVRLRQTRDTPQTPAQRGRFIGFRPTHTALLLHFARTRCNNDKTQDSLFSSFFIDGQDVPATRCVRGPAAPGSSTAPSRRR